MTMAFIGPPVTPLDTRYGRVHLPIPAIPCTPPTQQLALFYATLQQQFQSEIQTWQKLLYGSLCKAFSTTTLYATLSAHHPVMIVSDASVQPDGQSGFAWVIANKATLLWQGTGLAPGPQEDMYSGCAEAFGIFAAILFLQYYLSYFPTLSQVNPITCYCDNLGAITTLTNMQTQTIVRPNDTTNDDWDIYIAIDAAAKQCQMVNFHYRHVKGHQDNDPQRQLTIPEQHNVDCDKLAKSYVCNHRIQSTTIPTPEFTAAQPQLRIDGRTVCRRVMNALRQAAAAPAYWDYLRKRFTWSQSDLSHIQWHTFQAALRTFPCNDQRQLVLFTHDKLPLRTSKFHPHLGSPLCPSC